MNTLVIFFYFSAQYDNTDAAINFHICHGKAKQGDIWIENIDKSYMKNLEDYIYYCMSKKSWPILYSKLLYKMGQDFLDIHMHDKYMYTYSVDMQYK